MKKRRKTNLRAQAQGRECQIRLWCCRRDTEHTVLAHFRLISLRYDVSKPKDIIAAWACDACHAVVDSDKSPDVQLAFAHAVLRTQDALADEDLIQW